MAGQSFTEFHPDADGKYDVTVMLNLPTNGSDEARALYFYVLGDSDHSFRIDCPPGHGVMIPKVGIIIIALRLWYI